MKILKKSTRMNRASNVADTRPNWTDDPSAPLRESDDGRYARIGRIDMWRSRAYDMPPDPNQGEAEQRVRQLIEALPTNETSSRALDPTINSWVERWKRVVNTQAVDNSFAIDVHYAQSKQFEAQKEAELADAIAHLKELEEDRARARTVVAGRPHNSDTSDLEGDAR